MKIKAIYIKNLKMSEGKIAAQVAHAVKNLGPSPSDCTIVVLGVSAAKFKELTEQHECYIQVDMGLTEVANGTPTAAAWIDQGSASKKVDQSTKEVRGVVLGDVYEYYQCPHCPKRIEVSMFDNFCPKCGGKLDWSE